MAVDAHGFRRGARRLVWAGPALQCGFGFRLQGGARAGKGGGMCRQKHVNARQRAAEVGPRRGVQAKPGPEERHDNPPGGPVGWPAIVRGLAVARTPLLLSALAHWTELRLK